MQNSGKCTNAVPSRYQTIQSMPRSLLLLVIAFLFPCFNASGQIVDDFSDGDFSQTPAWAGDAASFVVNAAGELQLNAPAAGTSILVVQGNIPDSAIWNLRFRLSFAPSTQNLLRIYLLADQQNLSAGNGYFLEIGETGSQDALRFFRQDAGVKTLLATGLAALVATNPNIQLRVSRSVAGDWSVEAAPPAGALQTQFTVSDATYPGGADLFFGFQCVYTASNVGNFFFDNISILPDLPDVTPPVLLLASAANENQVLAIFDEDLDPVAANTTSNYSISGGVGEPESAILQSDKKSVVLTLLAPIATGNYTLQTTGIKDVAGNAAGVQTHDFQYVKIEQAEEFDIIINEIMADPSPSVGLPELEWLELYNRSGKIIDLASLRISESGGSALALPAFLLLPGGYALITAASNVPALQAVSAETVLAGPLSSIALNNESDVLTILNAASGQTIDRVSYTSEWHTDADKQDGGWSLERINPDLPCLGQENWQSCPDLPGGTPGGKNAAFEATSDTKAPRLWFAIPDNNTEVVLTFSEGLDYSKALNPAAYQFAPSRNILSVQPTPERSQVKLLLSEPLQPSVVYTLLLQNTIEDCSGNAVVVTDTILTGLPEKPGFQDIIINEILFNPPTGGSRYVELLNRSGKIFKWSEFFLANFNGGADIEPIVTGQLALPGKYQVFTSDRDFVINNYDNIHPRDVIRQTLPSLSDDSDNLTLYWAKNGETVTLDSLDYSDTWHNALFSSSDRDGVALERIRESGATNDRANWTSASPLLTGAAGSPTLPNSQRLGAAPATGDDLVSLLSERISPDDDGYEDFLEISYQLPVEGYEANITVFDAGGLPVRKLLKYNLIGTEGTLRWDGESDEGIRVRPGIYVLFMEIFGPSGEVKNFKRSISVVRRF